MTFKVLHQVGHNANWSIQSFEKDGCGDGLILSPVHQDYSAIEKLSSALKQSCLFDPQFYLPSSQKNKLRTYPFFPETKVGGFDTGSYLAEAKEAALECVAFQMEHDFQSVTIPARFIDQMYSDYIERHEEFTLQPFLDAIDELIDEWPICMTLPVTDHMIADMGFRRQILNWITKYPEIDQIYLIYAFERDTKQIQSADFLISLMDFVKEVQDTGLELIMGYQNTESLLFTIFDKISLTFGTFENTRIFSLDKFLVSDEERRGPKPRIYLPGLLNWVQYDQAKLIRSKSIGLWKKIYAPTEYSEQVLSRAVDPHFNQAELYKHHLICMSQQFKELNSKPPPDRGRLLQQWIKSALTSYSEVEDLGIYLDKHGAEGHLTAWGMATKHARDKLI